MIIAVDYDDTIKYKNGTFNIRLIDTLRGRQAAGDIIILWTCRSNARIREALAELKRFEFLPNFVNENTPHIIKKLGHNPRKIYADMYIDDKNAPFIH